MFIASFLQNGSNPSSTGESAEIPTIAEYFIESFSFFANPLDNCFGITTNKLLF
jgi:hypothetical protein